MKVSTVKKKDPHWYLKLQATFSIKEERKIKKKIQNLTSSYDDPPSIYLLFGQLSDSEMNGLYNHSKIKSMVSITKGEGFGRPLLEFSVTGKPVIARIGQDTKTSFLWTRVS